MRWCMISARWEVRARVREGPIGDQDPFAISDISGAIEVSAMSACLKMMLRTSGGRRAKGEAEWQMLAGRLSSRGVHCEMPEPTRRAPASIS